jgi:hypothetical protein
MRRLVRFTLPALIVLAASACHQQSAQGPSSAAVNATPPSSATDAVAWENYMVKVSHADLKGVTAKPYLFEVLAKSDPRASQRNPNIQQALTEMAKTGQFPGNAIAVGGPDPAATADVLVAAFGAAKAGSLQGFNVLYIGDQNDEARVKKVIDASGAAFRFVAM